MCGATVGDALMQMAHELEIAQRGREVLCREKEVLFREKTALVERVAALEKENVRLKLCYLKNQITVAKAA